MTLVSSHGKWNDHDIFLMIMVTIKGRFKSVECMNKGNELYDVWCTKFLKYDLFKHWVESICYVELENNSVGWRFEVHLMPWIIVSHPPLVTTLNWCGEKCVVKASQNWRHKVQLMSWYNVFTTTMGWTPLEDLVKVRRRATLNTCVIQRGMWPCVIWEQSWNNYGNPLAKFSRWKQFWRCSKTILEKLLTDKRGMHWNVSLKESVDSSKS